MQSSGDQTEISDLMANTLNYDQMNCY